MLRAIKFNYEEFPAAQEIHHERTERYLSKEFVAIEMTSTQLAPKAIFCLGFIGTQPSCAVR